MYAVHYVALVCLQITLQCEWHYTRHMCALVCLQTTLLWDIIHVLGRWKISTMCLLLSDLSHVNVWRVLIPSRVKVASSVNSVNGSTWRLVCNQWKNSRCMALSTGCSFCTRCGWCGSRASSCNVRHTYVRETPSSRDSNCVPISSFWVGNRQKLQGVVSVEYGASQTTGTLCLGNKVCHTIVWNNGNNLACIVFLNLVPTSQKCF